MSTCYLCKNEITEQNITIEHIILNSMGGRLKSSNLICKECNSKFGDSFDAKLSKQFEFFANILDIKRERGKVQDVIMVRESTGEEYRVTPDGKPIVNKPTIERKEIENGEEIHIQARNPDELKKILVRLKKKYPAINIDECLKKAKHIKERLSEPLGITLTLGGRDSMPAILKMAINFFVEITRDVVTVSEAIEDLRKNLTDKVEPIILEESLFDLGENEVTHSIFLNASPEEKKVYAIIELYGTIQFIVKLSKNYNGPAFIKLYVYDVLLTKEIQKKVNYIPDFNYIFSHEYPKSNPNFQILNDKMSHVMQIAMKRKNNSFISEIIKKSFDNTWGKLPEGKIITNEDVDMCLDELMKNIELYF
ncbi:HNH endonuclease [Treponema phagedenis]|uniref:HNH endonuclease n=1 Tax=Treponema phagedenis TaxID=162 RepID=UPI000465BBBE|nr:HNH endonuclease [Treponema phagedenis]